VDSDRRECATIPQMDVEVVGTSKGERVDFVCRGVDGAVDYRMHPDTASPRYLT
jgi:hypothetical protein